jgi:hypothetical protein
MGAKLPGRQLFRDFEEGSNSRSCAATRRLRLSFGPISPMLCCIAPMALCGSG